MPVYAIYCTILWSNITQSVNIRFSITSNRTQFKSDGMVRLSGFGSKTAHFVGGRKKRIISIPGGPLLENELNTLQLLTIPQKTSCPVTIYKLTAKNHFYNIPSNHLRWLHKVMVCPLFFIHIIKVLSRYGYITFWSDNFCSCSRGNFGNFISD